MYPQGNGPDNNWTPYDQQPYGQQSYDQQSYGQPPNDQQPYGQPGYPQDPYAQQQPPYQQADPYQQGHPGPGYPGPQYPGPQYPGPQYPGPQLPGPGSPRPSSSKTTLIIVGAVLGGFLLFCVAGIAVVALTPDEDTDPTAVSSAAATAAPGATATPTPAVPPTSAPTPTSTGSPSSYDLEGDLDQFKQGDCLTITGADREVKPAKCTDAGAMKVFLRRDGVDASRDDVCDAADEATDILFIDDVGTTNDLVLCVGKAT